MLTCLPPLPQLSRGGGGMSLDWRPPAPSPPPEASGRRPSSTGFYDGRPSLHMSGLLKSSGAFA